MAEDIKNGFSADFIAPCGLNCALCYAHLRKKNTCGGCRSADNLPNSCQRCVIRSCDKREGKDDDFCYVCTGYPCTKLKMLHKRYRTKYATDIRENQRMIQMQGMDAFLSRQEEQWTCPECGGIICMHKGTCDSCSPKEK